MRLAVVTQRWSCGARRWPAQRRRACCCRAPCRGARRRAHCERRTRRKVQAEDPGAPPLRQCVMTVCGDFRLLRVRSVQHGVHGTPAAAKLASHHSSSWEQLMGALAGPKSSPPASQPPCWPSMVSTLRADQTLQLYSDHDAFGDVLGDVMFITGEAMFMILSRSSKNRLGWSGFVKKSARLASLRKGRRGGAPRSLNEGCEGHA